MNEAKAQFETNFFGIVRMVKGVLPLMRHQKEGQIINISSLAALAPMPFMGIYSATKFAVDGYTEALRLEVKPFNIRVSQVEPGPLNTPMRTHRQAASHQLSEYDLWRQRALEAFCATEEKGPGPEVVAGVVFKIIASNKPRLRYVVGQQAKKVSFIKWLFPASLFEMGMRSSFRLDAK